MSPMTLIETHCHLYSEPLAADAGAALARAAERGVTQVIVPAYDEDSWDDLRSLTEHDAVHAAYGIHPWVAHEADPDTLRDRLAATLAAAPKVVAVGEIGLDSKLKSDGAPSVEAQRAVLRPQLELAVDLDLPVILHNRGCTEELLEELDRFGGRLRGVHHAYSKGVQLAERFVRAGLALGLGGAVTRPKARVRRTAARLPLERFVLETDAPSIGLDGVEPRDTEPQHVADVAAALAELRGESIATIAEVTTRHARRLFGLDA